MNTNRLGQETSPYLLQHAHNPVDWYPWGDEAFARARTENKPMLVSIGYSACHWCHVMERESFEDETVAAFMNAHFVNVKIDREERPDLDHIYMDAVQAIAGNGGWPLNVFLLPDGRPFYGGTYFPPRDMSQRPSWTTLLNHISGLYRDKRSELEAQADQLTNHIAGANPFGLPEGPAQDTGFPAGLAGTLARQLLESADTVDGGFGRAPKFPQTLSLRFLLQYYHYAREPAALTQVCLSLDRMILGGINDQLGGGFARYSTDAEWMAPHFEKMLYDNALLISVLCEAWSVTRKPLYAQTIRRTIAFLERELSGPSGGFFAALDADSEGVEGKFYVWSKAEIDGLLGDDAPAFCAAYDVSETGNWEGQNILRVLHPENAASEATDRACREKLLAARAGRVRPQTDDKVLLGWNALLITAFCQAYGALGDAGYKAQALQQLEFLERHLAVSPPHTAVQSSFSVPGNGATIPPGPADGRDPLFHHTWKAGRATIPAFLEDYAFLIQACIHAQEISGNGDWLEKAKTMTEYLLRFFVSPDDDYFVYTHENQDDVIFRKKEVYDGAVPSGNAVMAANLLYLGTVFDLPDWKQRSRRMVAGLVPAMTKYPGSFAAWATLVMSHTYGLKEIVLAGDPDPRKQQEFLAENVPNRIFQVSSDRMGTFPILRDKPATGPARFFLCQNYACQPPVTEVAELLNLMGIP